MTEACSSLPAYAALIQNNETDVVYRNPFGFSLQAIQAGGNFIIDRKSVV